MDQNSAPTSEYSCRRHVRLDQNQRLDPHLETPKNLADYGALCFIAP